MEMSRAYPGDRPRSEAAFRRDLATLAVLGWQPVGVEWGDAQLLVTYWCQDEPASFWRVQLAQLGRPFAAGILLAALILMALVPVLHSAWH